MGIRWIIVFDDKKHLVGTKAVRPNEDFHGP